MSRTIVAGKLADAAKALAGLGREHRGAFAAAALAELEVGRLPRQLTEAMAELMLLRAFTTG